MQMIKKYFGIASTALLFSLTTLAANAAEEAKFVRTAASSSAFETDFTRAAESTVNEVVCIKSFAAPRQQQMMGDPFGMFDFFFGPQQQQPRRQQRRNGKRDDDYVQSGLGSGVIVSEDGYIVTNNHVVANSEKLEVLLNDNSTYEARIIGTDEATDLALIKIDAKGLSPITFGDSEAVKIGEWVLAVGNPFGFNSTVTAGIVSAKARSLGSNSTSHNMGIESFIQTDAALNPGNSGGALVNLKGELIGINSAIYSNTGSYSGFSFAIPTTIVKKVITDLRQYGTVQRAVMGCSVLELDAKIAKEREITATKTGLVVSNILPRSTAKALGLQDGDVITAINNVNVKNRAELVEQLNKFRPGDNISVTFYRDNHKKTASATLRNTQGNTEITKPGDFAELGCAFMKIGNELKEEFGIRGGVQVTGVQKGLFKDAGEKDGFVIEAINGTAVNSSDDVEYVYNSIMKEDDEDKVMFLTGFYPTSGKKYYYAVNLNGN
ncbi:MAG: trypsin-like peptidase domain-containing protein [Muribaculaceae bacterium]|nr:trypsin-like peptidase domain-containing protein [Muribaculaceae bacterium]